MTLSFRAAPSTFLLCAFLMTPSLAGFAQTKAPAAAPASTGTPDRAGAYYHYGLAKIYENQAVSGGRQDLATQAIEQYKLALSADPDSAMLQDGIANLYFRLGRIREAVSAAQEQVNKHPDDVEAHTLLGRVYLRSLDDRQAQQGPQTQEMLTAAIKEYETIARLKPKDIETHLLLGQLYGLNHDSAKAEQQFQAAQAIDPNSEEVVLSMARLYTEQGDLNKAAKVISDVPAEDRSGRMNYALGGIYDQLKDPKKAADAYQAALSQDPDNVEAKRALAGALQASGQMDAAAKIYGQLVGADPQDAQALIRAADIQRQQGHYEQALATLKKAETLVSDNVELSYNEALVYDALGRFDESIKTIKKVLATTASPNGTYAEGDRSNRALFLDRLGIVDREAGKDEDAVAAYKQMAALGGEFQARGAEGEIDAYRDAHNWTVALTTARDAAAALPANRELQLAYARQLGDNGKLEEGVKLAETQLKGTPDDREVYVTLADMQARAKHWKQASEALDKAETTAAKPEDKLFIYYFRGSIAEREKLYDQADAEFRKGLAIDANYAAIENDYGYMLAERGLKLPEATAMLQKAVQYDPQNGAYLDSLAWAYFKQGQYTMAEDTERKAALRQPNDPSILAHLGEIYAHNGKLSMAVSEWERSMAEYATSLPPEADPVDVNRTQHQLESARVRLAHAGSGPGK
ncbi:MAG: tetratricopeptide repeat protein [Janthinobacterium lividum]